MMIRLFAQLRHLCSGAIIILASLVGPQGDAAETSPYPPSAIISDMSFDWETHDRWAPGSDNWPITWADDDHQYTSWGDGGGFGGTNEDGRVSLGFARVQGTATSYQGYNVCGGEKGANPATFDGKSYGIISIGGVLYAWVSPGSGPTGYSEARLYRSSNYGAVWSPASWAFTQTAGMIFPTFLQFGKDYQGARDTNVYIFATNLKDADALQVQTPGEIVLLRVPATRLMESTAYEFFAGLDSTGRPTWTTTLSARKPVFRDRNGVGWTVSGSFNAGLKRYILMTEHTETSLGYFEVFDAPEPWGPWTTVKYSGDFGAPHIEASTFFWNFSTKWLSADGVRFTLVFTGIGENDSWNTIRGSFVLKEPHSLPPASPTRLKIGPG